MRTEFNHAANDSPRSGGSKRMTPVVCGVAGVLAVIVVVWLMLHAWYRGHRVARGSLLAPIAA